MNSYINVKLFDDEKLIFSKENVPADINMGKHIIFPTDNDYNKFDYQEKIFTRKTEEFIMKIDFKNKTCKIIFDDEYTCKFDVECEIIIKKEHLKLRYKIDSEIKTILIDIKDITL